MLLTIACADTAAAVACVEVIDKPFEADDEIIVFVERIDIFRRREDADIVLPQVVDKQGSLRSVSAQTG